MNTLFLKSDLQELALIVAKLKESEAAAEMFAASEENVSDKYAYKYGVMIGRVNAIADAFESRLALIEKSLEMGVTKPAITAEKPKSITFLENSGYYDCVLQDIKSATTYDEAIDAFIVWFNDLDTGYELGADYESIRDHAVQAHAHFDRNGLVAFRDGML